MSEIQDVETLGEALVVKFAGDLEIRFEDCWLRDHCRCSECYHADKFQRAKHILEVPETQISGIDFDEEQLLITWDDGHRSRFCAQWLRRLWPADRSEALRLRPIPWRGPSAVAGLVAREPAHLFLESAEGARRVFQSLLDHGVAFVEQVQPTLEATGAVCEALGGVQHTLFGGVFQFSARADHADIGYSPLPLASHTDNTYFSEAAGLLVLHCLEHTGGSGGETTLVDGFAAAERLRDRSPDEFNFLTSFDVDSEYVETGHHHRFAAPVIRVDPRTGDLLQIRFNSYDRAAASFASQSQCRLYYRSLRCFARIIEDPSSRWQLKLRPGTVIAIDNFRVLHGRTAFTGSRTLGGSYVSRSDWMDRARTLGLIH